MVFPLLQRHWCGTINGIFGTGSTSIIFQQRLRHCYFLPQWLSSLHFVPIFSFHRQMFLLPFVLTLLWYPELSWIFRSSHQNLVKPNNNGFGKLSIQWSSTISVTFIWNSHSSLKTTEVSKLITSIIWGTRCESSKTFVYMLQPRNFVSCLHFRIYIYSRYVSDENVNVCLFDHQCKWLCFFSLSDISDR